MRQHNRTSPNKPLAIRSALLWRYRSYIGSTPSNRHQITIDYATGWNQTNCILSTVFGTFGSSKVWMSGMFVKRNSSKTLRGALDCMTYVEKTFPTKLNKLSCSSVIVIRFWLQSIVISRKRSVNLVFKFIRKTATFICTDQIWLWTALAQALYDLWPLLTGRPMFGSTGESVSSATLCCFAMTCGA